MLFHSPLFPFTPYSFPTLYSPSYLVFNCCVFFPGGPGTGQSDGKEVGMEALDGKVLAVYFSASWCAPCKQFTPILKSVYNTLKEAGESP